MLQFGASLLTTLAKGRIVNYDCNCSFIVLVTVITIINYDRHLFIVQATDYINCDIFYCRRKKLTNFSCAIKTAASLFPFNCVTFLSDAVSARKKQRKRISHKQSARWQHLSQIEGNAFFFL